MRIGPGLSKTVNQARTTVGPWAKWQAATRLVCDLNENALAERINGLYRSELVHCHGSWRNIQDLEMATLGRGDWFNNRRLLGPIGNIPPAEAEENFQAQGSVPERVIGVD